MGLLTGLQNEADDVARRAAVQNTQANRQVTGYNAAVSAKTAEMTPLQEIIKHYNTDIANYNGGHYDSGQTYQTTWNGRYVSQDPSGLVKSFDAIDAPAGYQRHAAGQNVYGNPLYSFNKYAKPDPAAATAANTSLTNQKTAIDALNARGKSVTARNERTQVTAGREAERLDTSIGLQQRAIQEEQQGPQSSSVLDQNMVGIHQTIADWLK